MNVHSARVPGMGEVMGSPDKLRKGRLEAAEKSVFQVYRSTHPHGLRWRRLRKHSLCAGFSNARGRPAPGFP